MNAPGSGGGDVLAKRVCGELGEQPARTAKADEVVKTVVNTVRNIVKRPDKLRREVKRHG